jgi:hypothetical protein
MRDATAISSEQKSQGDLAFRSHSGTPIKYKAHTLDSCLLYFAVTKEHSGISE